MECASRSVPVAAALSPAVAVAHLTCKEIDRVHAFTLADATAATCSRLRNAEDEAERWREEEWGTISLRLHPLSNPVTPWDWDTKPTFIPIAIVPSKTLQIFLPQKRTLSGAPHKFPDPRPKMLHDPETELPTLRLNLWNAETALWGGGCGKPRPVEWRWRGTRQDKGKDSRDLELLPTFHTRRCCWMPPLRTRTQRHILSDSSSCDV